MKKIMTIEDYHAEESISKSKLDAVEESIRYCKVVDGKLVITKKYAQSDSFDFGSAVHDCVLLPDVFKAKYASVSNLWDGRKKEFRELKAEYDSLGVMIIKEDEYNVITEIRERIMAMPITRNIIERSEPEVSYFAEMTVGDRKIKVKCRPDALDGVNMIDLKTTRDCSRERFIWAIKNYRYHVQSAFYPDVYELATGNKIENFLFIAIDNSEPNNIKAYVIDRESEDIGRRDYKKNMLTIKKILDNPEQELKESIQIETIGLPNSSFIEV